jgi:hypothetical protein
MKALSCYERECISGHLRTENDPSLKVLMFGGEALQYKDAVLDAKMSRYTILIILQSIPPML